MIIYVYENMFRLQHLSLVLLIQCVPQISANSDSTYTLYIPSIYSSVLYTTVDPNPFRGTHCRTQKEKRYIFLTLIVCSFYELGFKFFLLSFKIFFFLI